MYKYNFDNLIDLGTIITFSTRVIKGRSWTETFFYGEIYDTNESAALWYACEIFVLLKDNAKNTN